MYYLLERKIKFDSCSISCSLILPALASQLTPCVFWWLWKKICGQVILPIRRGWENESGLIFLVTWNGKLFTSQKFAYKCQDIYLYLYLSVIFHFSGFLSLFLLNAFFLFLIICWFWSAEQTLSLCWTFSVSCSNWERKSILYYDYSISISPPPKRNQIWK